VRNSGVRYVFPKGCKVIDVQIDNSSRLRTIGAQRNFEITPRLPVTYPNRSDTDNKYNHYKPSNSYPGPSHIYVPPNIVSYLEPPSSYVRPPPPPPNPANSYVRPTPSPLQISPNNPTNNVILSTPTPSENIQNTYLPPVSAVENISTTPASTYLPPQKPLSIYLPPESNTNKPTTARPILSPSTPQNFYIGNLTELVPPKEEKEEVICPTQKECCDESSSGKLMIPIALMNGNSNDCCIRTAKLIIPLHNFDEAAVAKLKDILEKLL
jgi:hypothetical protein